MKKFNRLLLRPSIYITVILLSLFILYNSIIPIIKLIIENQELVNNEEQLDEEIKQTTTQLKIIENDESKQDILRSQYHMSNDGEIIYVFPEN